MNNDKNDLIRRWLNDEQSFLHQGRTVTALFVGLTAGIVLGAIGAQQIAKNWPHSQLVHSASPMAAPSPLHFGKSASEAVVLCDTSNFAYTLVDYQKGNIVPRAWLGIQELSPVFDKTSEQGSKDSSSTAPMPQLRAKCL